MQNVVIEGDSLNVVTQLPNSTPSSSAYGGIIEKIKLLAASLFSCTFSFTKRDGNKLAHLLSQDVVSNSFGDSSDLLCMRPDV